MHMSGCLHIDSCTFHELWDCACIVFCSYVYIYIAERLCMHSKAFLVVIVPDVFVVGD